MKKKTKKSGSNIAKLAVVGAGLAGLATAAYFFLGPKGKKNQKHFKTWAIKMKADILEKIEMTHDISEAVYSEIINSVAAEYKKGKIASNNEINALAQDLKKHWNTISKGARATKHGVVKSAKRVVKKARR